MISIVTKRKARLFIITLISMVIVLLIFETKIRKSNLFNLAFDFFKNDERISSRIGEVKAIRLNILGTKLWRDKARIGLMLNGEKGNMPAWAWLKRLGDEWIVYEAGIIL